MNTNETDMNAIRSCECGHDKRGKPLLRSRCDGHILVLCILPYKLCVGWVKIPNSKILNNLRLHDRMKLLVN